MPHEQTRTLPKCASYPNTTVCMPVHIHTHLHWLQMQYILFLLSKTLITLHSLISHKYSEGRAVIRAYIYPTWLGEKPVQCCPQGWASPTRLLPRVERGQQWTHMHCVPATRGGGGAGGCTVVPQLGQLKTSKFMSCSPSQQSLNASGKWGKFHETSIYNAILILLFYKWMEN